MKAVTVAALVALTSGGLLLAGVEKASAAASVSARKMPYWASLGAGQARMRTGPGRNYPATWLYQRKGLPVQVIDVYPGWRKVRDPDGAEGWMIGSLIVDQRTAMVKGGTADLRDSPRGDSRIVWRAEPGVIGRLSRCDGSWCKIDVQGRDGYVEEDRLWGVDANEQLN